MYAQRLKVGTAAVLVVLVAVMGAAIGVATAQCAFTLTATPSSAAPDASVALDAKCLHDAFGNKVSGATVNFDVKLPDGSAAPTQMATTDANGDASTTYTGTSQYGSYSAKASSGAASASTSFSVAPGAPAGTFAVSATPASQTAGSGVTLTASGITDSATPGGKPVANGTPVSFSVTRPDGTLKSYSGTTSGVSSSADTASASASVPGADIQKAGSYSVAATAGAASGSGAFTIVAGALASLKAVAPASLVVGDPAGGSFGASDATDEFGNPVGGASIALHFEDPVAGLSGSDGDTSCTTDAAGACSVTAAADQPDQIYGLYTLTASSGTVSDSKTFDVQPGPAATIGEIAANPSSAPAATSVTITVNMIKSALNAAAKSGTVVGLSVTGPSGTKSYSGTVSGVDSRADNAGVAITIPGADNTTAGSYAVHATADGAMADTTYTVVAGPPAADLGVTAPDVRVGKPNTVSVSNIPSTATSVELTVTKPSGATLTKTATPSADGTASFALTGAETGELGTYGLSARAKSELGQVVGSGSGSFKTTQALLAVSAPNITLGQANTVTISDIPEDATSVLLNVTRPDGTSLSKTVNAPGVTCDPLGNCTGGSFPEGKAKIGLSSAELNQTGAYSLSALAKDGSGAAIATGTGSFSVGAAPTVGPEPTNIVVTTSPSGTINPTQQVFITATATGATGPSFNRTLVFEVQNPLGIVVSRTRVTDSQGRATVSVGGPYSVGQMSETALPGQYKITVRYIPTGTVGTGSFNVLI